MAISPEVGLSSPVSMVVMVDLPAPEAPTKATMLLGGMVRLYVVQNLLGGVVLEADVFECDGLSEVRGLAGRVGRFLVFYKFPAEHTEVTDATGVSQEFLERRLRDQGIDHGATDDEENEQDFDKTVAGDFYGIDQQARDNEHEEEIGAVLQYGGQCGLLVFQASLLPAGFADASEYASVGVGGLEVFEVREPLDDV